MEKLTPSFLLLLDEKHKINTIYWSEPEHLITPFQVAMNDLVHPGDWEKMEKILQEVLSGTYFHTGCETFRSPDGTLNFLFSIQKIGNQLLVHGMDQGFLSDESTCEVIRRQIMNLLKIVEKHHMAPKSASHQDHTVRDQFEEIQQLNNNLLNMQRQLKKANVVLNQLNTDLNNRLVKDSLTGLVSRYQYRDEIEQLISKHPDQYGVFAFIDLDDFKSINDTYGHRAGDDFLKIFAERLQMLPFEKMICMRISGDEFGVFLHGYDLVSEEMLEKIWSEMKRVVLSDPITIDEASLPVSFSVGMSIYNKDTTDIYDLIEYADFAMYGAKNSGKNGYTYFDEKMYRLKKISRL